MLRNAAALIALCASLQGVHATPPADNPAPDQHRGAPSISQSIHQATDHAGELVRNALQSLGVPYRRGGTSAATGFDCSGFVRTTYEQAVGLVLPRRAYEQAAATRKIERNDLQPGDLVFFNTLKRAYSHVGIYLGEGQFIHAPRTGARVRVESMNTRYWKARFNGARRALQAQTQSTPSVAATPRPAGLAAQPERPTAEPTAPHTDDTPSAPAWPHDLAMAEYLAALSAQ